MTHFTKKIFNNRFVTSCMSCEFFNVEYFILLKKYKNAVDL